ncbi:hypothetical protein SAMN04490179_5011 [Pseudomonas antarctica]|uniref:Uncharacterized protein n=1 Tax=Pseudomonas antarctica TaxID=219572 RepID=A0A1H0CQQ6_9PSED|nr:hypothetical protein PSAN_53300 [Pseudomonas antarctica]SDN60178.1 hypothetical protein SAMN04490179_5011 [Pseudomonas antarctica]
MRRFKQLIAGRHWVSMQPDRRVYSSESGFEIPLKRWFGVASHLPADF